MNPVSMHSPNNPDRRAFLKNASAAVGDTFTASVQLYDALGDVHVATITYTNTAPGACSLPATRRMSTARRAARG